MTEIKVPTIFTTNGNPDLSQVQPNEHVMIKPAEETRGILLPAGEVLDENNRPVSEAPDGGVRMIDGAYATKLGGEVIGISEAHQNDKN